MFYLSITLSKKSNQNKLKLTYALFEHTALITRGRNARHDATHVKDGVYTRGNYLIGEARDARASPLV